VLVVIAAVGGGAALYFAGRTPPQGRLVAPTGITVETIDTTPVKRRAKPPRHPAAKPETPCWSSFGGGPLRTLSRPDIHLGVPQRSVWARGLHDLMEYPPIYCNGRLFVNLELGKTVALDAVTGDVLWSRRAPGPTASSPAISGQDIIVSSHGGTVSALRQKDGSLVWQLRVSVPVESSPVVVDGTAYVGASDGRLFALDARTGKARWVYDVQGRISSSPSVVGGLVCITTYTGVIACLHRGDGARAWSRYFKRDPFRYDSFYSSASSDGRRLFAISRAGQLMALDARTGRTIWSYRTGGLTYGTPSVAHGRLFVADLNRNLMSFRTRDGHLLWRERVSGRVLGPTAVIGDLVFFSTLEGQTYAARVSNGRIVWHFHAGKYAPGIATGKHYFLSMNGLLVAFVGTGAAP
jgi:outer membrane protein assembly factor BamB